MKSYKRLILITNLALVLLFLISFVVGSEPFESIIDMIMNILAVASSVMALFGTFIVTKSKYQDTIMGVCTALTAFSLGVIFINELIGGITFSRALSALLTLILILWIVVSQIYFYFDVDEK